MHSLKWSVKAHVLIPNIKKRGFSNPLFFMLGCDWLYEASITLLD